MEMIDTMMEALCALAIVLAGGLAIIAAAVVDEELLRGFIEKCKPHKKNRR